MDMNAGRSDGIIKLAIEDAGGIAPREQATRPPAAISLYPCHN
jgi:hypothetical protein